MLAATCHCGAVRIEVVRRPRTLTDCNCSICRRYGSLWAYYRAGSVRVVAASDALAAYAWGGRRLEFFRCRRCGCVTHHERSRKRPDSTVGVNARNFPPEVLARARIRRLDGASSWKYLD
ncbi:GFA family protein [Luteimonas aquatica]|uniref:GFA family protein n=1 Tax=Luteimonas aquatica TaxID=450364 RepID=UPI001F55D6DE|nr:hypothetical protein [Luteimonas aquatica]